MYGFISSVDDELVVDDDDDDIIERDEESEDDDEDDDDDRMSEGDEIGSEERGVGGGSWGGVGLNLVRLISPAGGVEGVDVVILEDFCSGLRWLKLG